MKSGPDSQKFRIFSVIVLYACFLYFVYCVFYCCIVYILYFCSCVPGTAENQSSD